jgi:hypothetical protein
MWVDVVQGAPSIPSFTQPIYKFKVFFRGELVLETVFTQPIYKFKDFFLGGELVLETVETRKLH